MKNSISGKLIFRRAFGGLMALAFFGMLGTANAALIGVADLKVGGGILGEASSGDIWIRFQNPGITDVFVTSVIDGDTGIVLILQSGSDFDAAVSRLTDGVDSILFACGGKFGAIFGCVGFGESFFFGASGLNGVDFAGFEISKIQLEINNVEVRFDSDQDVTFISADLRLSIFDTSTVVIDIKPGSDPNGVNPRSKGVIPVAVLGTVDFDATQVDFSTVVFGPGEASPVHDGHVENVNGDFFDDMAFHFNTQDTGIACGDTEATLSGETFGGDAFTGTDSVKTAGCK